MGNKSPVAECSQTNSSSADSGDDRSVVSAMAMMLAQSGWLWEEGCFDDDE